MKKLLGIASIAAHKAGRAIKKIRHEGFNVNKKEDETPVTKADLQADKIIQTHLKKTGIPILSEETKDDKARLKSKHVWIIDPIDGTKDFIAGENEFTVNIALIQNGKPILGVVYAPTLNKFYEATKNKAWLNSKEIHTNQKKSFKNMIFLESKRHHEKPVKNFLKENTFKKNLKISSSYKGCLLAEGKADIIVRLTAQSTWDVAAMHAIIQGAGGKMVGITNNIHYNKESTRVRNYVAISNPNLTQLACWKAGKHFIPGYLE